MLQKVHSCQDEIARTIARSVFIKNETSARFHWKVDGVYYKVVLSSLIEFAKWAGKHFLIDGYEVNDLGQVTMFEFGPNYKCGLDPKDRRVVTLDSIEVSEEKCLEIAAIEELNRISRETGIAGKVIKMFQNYKIRA